MQGALVFYDGRCGLCRGSVAAAAKRMRPGALRFVDNGLPEATGMLGPRGLLAASADSLIVVAGGRAFLRSDAVLEMASRLRWPWRALAAFRIVPRPLRDWAYGEVARRRDRGCALRP